MSALIVKLGDICNIQSGGTPSRGKSEFWEGGCIPWVKISDMHGKFLSQTEEYITDAGLAASSTKMFSRGTILYTIFATLGETCILNIDATTNQAIAGISVKHEFAAEIAVEYLYYFLMSIKEHIMRVGRGVAQNNINLRILRNVNIVLPSLERQNEIVRRLSDVESILSLRQRQAEKLDELVKARFVEMFGNLRKNDKNWPMRSLVDFAKIDTQMIHDLSAYEDYPHIGIDSIEKGTGHLSGYHTVKEDGVISGKYLFTPKHIIYSKIRPNLNKVALPDFTGVCSADAYPILPESKLCDRVFLAYVMRSELFLSYILAFANRTNLPKVNKKQVEGFSCPLPPLPLQNAFATFVHEVDREKERIQRSAALLETLKRSLMQQYFG